MEFSKRLKELRLSAGLTQQQLADRTQVGKPYISKLEGGRYDVPPPETTWRLALALAAELPISTSALDDEFNILGGRLPEGLEDVLLERPGLVDVLRDGKGGPDLVCGMCGGTFKLPTGAVPGYG